MSSRDWVNPDPDLIHSTNNNNDNNNNNNSNAEMQQPSNGQGLQNGIRPQAHFHKDHPTRVGVTYNQSNDSAI